MLNSNSNSINQSQQQSILEGDHFGHETEENLGDAEMFNDDDEYRPEYMQEGQEGNEDDEELHQEEDEENFEGEDYYDDGEQEHKDEEEYEEEEHIDEDSRKNLSYNPMNEKNFSKISDGKTLSDDDDESLPAERRVRYRLFRFINKLRTVYRFPEYSQELLGDKLAMAYADYLLKEKENESVLNQL